MFSSEFTDPCISFLVFRSRSGSTIFGDRLSRHPGVLVTPESNVAQRLVQYFKENHANDIVQGDILDFIYNEKKFSEWGLPKELLENEIKRYRAHDWATIFYACCKAYRDWKKPAARIVVFKKSGWYYKNVNLLLSTFPDSVTIWMLRDPRAMYNSARKALHSEKGTPMAKNMVMNAIGWRDYVNRMLEAGKRWPGRVCKVCYESFVVDTSGILLNIWRKLGVPELTPAELKRLLKKKGESHLITSSTKHLHGNVTEEAIVERAYKWKDELPKWRAGIIRLICKKPMTECGYGIEESGIA